MAFSSLIIALGLLGLWGTVSSSLKGPSPYTVFNYTWVIINQAGDVVNSSSSIGTEPQWPTLLVDLCALVLGAGPDWGVSSIFWPTTPPQSYSSYKQHIGCHSCLGR